MNIPHKNCELYELEAFQNFTIVNSDGNVLTGKHGPSSETTENVEDGG